jgi:hypothetical protein
MNRLMVPVPAQPEGGNGKPVAPIDFKKLAGRNNRMRQLNVRLCLVLLAP